MINSKTALVKSFVINALKYAAEEMGVALTRAAYSTNITEREDRSTAVFDPKGRLVSQAEHIPVHLGSLAIGFSKILSFCEKEGIQLNEGTMIVANNPYLTQSHLPDIIVVRPVYLDKSLVAYVVNKGHHVDIGGSTPGSRSVNAKTIFDEGLIINPVQIVRENKFVDDVIRIISSNSRNPKEREGDLRAQVAANFTGERKVLQVIKYIGAEKFQEIVDELINDTKVTVLKRMREMEKKSAVGAAEEWIELPDGNEAKIKASVEFTEDKMIVDFDGTDSQISMPYNAPIGVTAASTFYIVKSLFGSDLTANDGFLSCFDIRAPEGSIVNATFPYPVALCNTIVSQKVTELVFAALDEIIPGRVPAGTSGSYNSISLNGTRNGVMFNYSETNGAGRGAIKGLAGISGIQIYMTNTKNTPIEDVELKFPVLMTRYELRDGSGGRGKFRGGDGIIREFMATEDNIMVIVHTERMKHPPKGLHGGGDGERTVVTITRSGMVIDMPVKFQTILNKGNILSLYTTGGGGYLPED